MPKGSWIRFGQQQTPWLDYAGGHLPLPLPGHDVRRARGLSRPRPTRACRSTTTSRTTTATCTSASTTARATTTRRRTTRSRSRCGARSGRSRRAAAARGPARHGVLRRGQLRQERPRSGASSSNVTFEHKYLQRRRSTTSTTNDQKSCPRCRVSTARASRSGSRRARTVGWEGLMRYDHLTPDTTIDAQTHKRTIVGVAYWFPHTGGRDGGDHARLRPRPVRHT